MEAEWLGLAREGKTVDVKMKVLYGDSSFPTRPTAIVVEFEIDGVIQPEEIFKNVRN